MKTQLTPEEVARRATSPEAALDVSREVWVGRAEMSEKELKELLLGSDMCGLCQWYGVDETAGCQRYRRGPCVLEEKRGCCSEYYKASEVLGAYQRGNTTEAQVRSAFWAMVARLDAERAKLPKEKPKPAMLREDVEQFGKRVSGGGTFRATITCNNEIEFRCDCGYATATRKEAKEIELKLRQLLATAERRAKNEDC